MKKKLFILVVGLVGLVAGPVVVSSCTKQSNVRNFGGTEVIEVEPGKRVMMATWKDDDLFYMVEDMPEGYIPQEKKLIESSSYGIIESTIIFKERR